MKPTDAPAASPAFDPEVLVDEVAEAMLADLAEDGEAPETLAGLDEDERSDLRSAARAAIVAFTAAIQRLGVRLLPPGAVPRPQSAEEAALFTEAARQFFETQRRKAGLIGSVSPGLVVPKHLNGRGL